MVDVYPNRMDMRQNMADINKLCTIKNFHYDKKQNNASSSV